ncbi:MAG: sigma 54-interacting transcriptional regulator [Thermoanaerobaculia bacterium]|nr:sigma 54-interacting transcriptional regulator [Thermoanaerobaculia bacterium]
MTDAGDPRGERDGRSPPVDPGDLDAPDALARLRVRLAESPVGAVVFAADERADLDAILAAAAERARLAAHDSRRQARRTRLERLLPELARALDVRQVFLGFAPLVREIVPNDVLAFSQISADRGGVQVQAATVDGLHEMPEYRFTTEIERLDSNWDYLVAHDLEPVGANDLRVRKTPRDQPADFDLIHPGEAWVGFIRRAGIRSSLRVPIRSQERPIGGVAFLSRQPFAYDDEDGELAFRIADHLALAIAFQRLAEESRHAAVVQERERQVEAALPLLDSLERLDDIAFTLSRSLHGLVEHDALGVAVRYSDGGRVHGVVDGDRRVTSEVGGDFFDEQARDFATAGSVRLRDLEIVDEQRRRVRQFLADEPGTIREVVASPSNFEVLRAIRSRSELRVPVLQGSELVGVVLLSSRRPDRFTEADAALVRRFAVRVSLRLARETIEQERRSAQETEARNRELEERVDRLAEELERFTAHRAHGQSPAWRKVLADATEVAATDTTVLVTGESGTGKEVVARLVHRGSPRANGPFVALNCAALPENLLESELFGHERGAFTGALEARPGKIEQASGGVLFLDEVGEMSPVLQAKFLRVLQEREFQRVGGQRTLKANVRVVAATNRDPKRAIASGEFREDLYYRLSVFEIHLPPLRERPEDILVLAEAFLAEIGHGVGRPSAGFSEDAREQLLAHTWPGNVRELRNAIERAVILARGGLVTRDHLPRPIADRPGVAAAIATAAAAGAPRDLPAEGVRMGEVERELLVQAMTKAGQNKSQAAKLLGLSRGQLYSLLRRHHLTAAKR